MALISRYLFEVQSSSFVDQSPALFLDWVCHKRRDSSIELPVNGVIEFDGGHDLRVRSGADGEIAAFRGSYFEQRENEQVRTTFTALTEDERRWAWIDLERWFDDPFAADWVPYTPRLVGSVIGYASCFRGPTQFSTDYLEAKGKDGKQVAEQILDPAREVPVVVTTPTKDELAGDITTARERAHELQLRLRGIAPVVMLGKGAVESFSRAIPKTGDIRLDVYGGAVRTYLPGAGRGDDWLRRHRLIPFHRLRDRPASRAGRLVTLPVLRAACQALPPPAWTEGARDLVGAVSRTDADLEHLIELSESEKKAAERQREDAELRSTEAVLHLEKIRESETELLDELETVKRRYDYARRQLGQQGEVPEEPPEPPEPPDFCSEVVELAEEHSRHLVFGPDVEAAAEALDEHAESSWARKAWRVFRSMQAYAEAKTDGDSEIGGFLGFCERSGHSEVIPSSWIAPGESETTDQNHEFRRQRTFSVPTEVNASGSLYMPAHVKIEQGGNPAPRIHFYDDTDGVTGKIYIGWFGPHRDSRAKS